MSDADEPGFSNLGFAKTVVLPALWVFMIPLIALGVFAYAQSSYDTEAMDYIRAEVAGDATLAPAEKEAILAHWEAHPLSELAADPVAAADLDPTMVRHYAIFRWMIGLSGGSILAGLLVFLLGGLSVAASRRSQQAQYISLSVAWHVLRLFAAAQVVIQGGLLVALSFWVTALLFNVFSVKLVLVTGLLAVMAMFAILKAMWVRLDDHFAVEGEVLPREAGVPFWEHLDALCERVGTAPPDQLIAGIDDNFFVTEHAVTVGEAVHTGRTLYVSLSLLKQLDGAEADAVLAHEMAHFSGQDTTYSKKIAPLLGRYQHYLQALAEGGITLPIFYFMACFRTLFELSLRSLSREREFRADRVAAEATSAEAMAGALLRIAAYSTYRGTVERELFEAEEALESADISSRLEGGFGTYAVAFAAEEELGAVRTAHPFDTHPQMAQRLEAVGMPLSDARAASLLAEPGDGRWFARIPEAEALERAQWAAYEQRFRDFHEEVLAWRYLPEGEAQQALVEKFFPALVFHSADPLELDHVRMARSSWPEPVRLDAIAHLALDEHQQLLLTTEAGTVHVIPVATYGEQAGQLLAEVERYVGRARSAAAYQAERRVQA